MITKTDFIAGAIKYITLNRARFYLDVWFDFVTQYVPRIIHTALVFLPFVVVMWRSLSWGRYQIETFIKWKHSPRHMAHCEGNMMTSSNGNIFRVTGPLCGEFAGPGEFPAQRPVTRSFDVFFDLRLNKRLSEQPWGWWFETPSWSLWHHRNESISQWGQWPGALMFSLICAWRNGWASYRDPGDLRRHRDYCYATVMLTLLLMIIYRVSDRQIPLTQGQ